MVAHRIVTQQFYFQCLRISSVTLICFVYTPIEKMVGYVGNAPTQPEGNGFTDRSASLSV